MRLVEQSYFTCENITFEIHFFFTKLIFPKYFTDLYIVVFPCMVFLKEFLEKIYWKKMKNDPSCNELNVSYEK